jgi:hypothetical protein
MTAQGSSVITGDKEGKGMSDKQSSKPTISEDWWAVIVGTGLMILVKVGILGGLIPIP